MNDLFYDATSADTLGTPTNFHEGVSASVSALDTFGYGMSEMTYDCEKMCMIFLSVIMTSMLHYRIDISNFIKNVLIGSCVDTKIQNTLMRIGTTNMQTIPTYGNFIPICLSFSVKHNPKRGVFDTDIKVMWKNC